jgi:WD40 repeat protein
MHLFAPGLAGASEGGSGNDAGDGSSNNNSGSAAAAASSDGFLFLSSLPNQVKLYNLTTGSFDRDFISTESNGGLSNPRQMTFGSDGNLYVLGGLQIMRYNGTTGAFLDDFVNVDVESGSGQNELADFVFGPDGNIYVTFGRSFVAPGAPVPQFVSEIKRYNGTTGEFIDNFVPDGSGGIFQPKSLAFGPDGNLYVTTASASGITVNRQAQILRFDGTTGEFIDSFVPPAGNSSGLNGPGDMIFGPDGNLYVVNSQPPMIKRYNGTTGEFLDNFVSASASIDSAQGLASPSQMVFGPDGNLYVGDGFKDQVKRYNGTTGEFLGDFVPSDSTNPPSPGGVAFGPDGNLYAANSPASEVNRYDGATGAFISVFVSSASSGGLNNPAEIAFGPDGNLYVISSATNEVKRYNGTTGAFIDNFVTSKEGRLDFPRHLAWGPDGNLYVSNFSSDEITRHDGTTGELVDIFVHAGEGGLSIPGSLAFGPDGNLYVTSGPYDIKLYNGTTGAFMDNLVSAGDNGLFLSAAGITFGPDGNLYASSSTGDVLHYDITTKALLGNFVDRAESGGLQGPSTLAFGPDDNLYVIDSPANQVKRYNGTTGAFIDNFVASGSGGLSAPLGMAFGPPPPAPHKAMLVVNAVDEKKNGEQVSGVWTTIHDGTGGAVLKKGFTPLTFQGLPGAEYVVTVANYDGKEFVRWQDDDGNDGTSKSKTVRLHAGNTTTMTLTAIYDTGDSMRGFTPLTFAGAGEGQPDLTVNAVLVFEGERQLQMWTVIDPQLAPDASAGPAMTFKLYASDYQDKMFYQWSDGSKDRIRTLTIEEDTEIVAYYVTAPSVIFTQKTVEEQPGNSFSTRGVDARFACPDDSGTSGDLFGFHAFTNGSAVTGRWGTSGAPGAAGGDQGAVTSAHITPANFKVEGTWESDGESETGGVCQAAVPSAVLIEGPCGNDVEVTFSAANGVRGTFRGDVACITR